MQPSASSPAAPWRDATADAQAQTRSVWLKRAASPLVLTLVTVLGIAALGGVVGADARWLAALGARIADRREIPAAIPFAAAPTAHWHNAIVLAELIFHALEATMADRGLMLAQLLAVACAAVVLMRDARAGGASAEGAGAAVLLAALGAISSVAIARVQLFSLILFPVLAAILRAEARNPSRRIWLVLPLIAVWANLHGAVLIGLGVLMIYLAVDRARHSLTCALGVGAGSLVAACCTPAGLGTIGYFHGLLSNQAAARGQLLWAPLSVSSPLDVLTVLVMLVFAVKLLRRRPPPWELVVSVVLAIATIKAARSGVWLVLFCAVPAARGFASVRWWSWVMPPVATLALLALVIGIVRGPTPNGASAQTIARASALAGSSPVLADDVIAEQLALHGARIWIGNPLDAFAKRAQNDYLDWIEGKPSGVRALAPSVRVVVTAIGDPASRLMNHAPGFVRVWSGGRANIYLRSAAGSGA